MKTELPPRAINTWQDFAEAAPELADFGAGRFVGAVAYLATITARGAPRVHPVSPIIGCGKLFIFMEPTSPKGHDLKRVGLYAMHSSVRNSEGEGGEFFVSGVAQYITDPAVREMAVKSSSYKPEDRYILFELGVESAASTVYGDGQPVRARWTAAPAVKH